MVNRVENAIAITVRDCAQASEIAGITEFPDIAQTVGIAVGVRRKPIGANGETLRLGRENIVALRGSDKSLMPEGLEEGLGVQELADLLAFLKGL